MTEISVGFRFIEDTSSKLYFAIDIRAIGEKPETMEAIKIFRLPKTRQMKLAVVEPDGQGWKTVEPPKPIDNGKGHLTVNLTGEPEKGATFWRWQIFVEINPGVGTLVVHAGKTKAHAAVGTHKYNTPTPTKVVLKVGRFPRLVVGLNQAAVPIAAGPPNDPLLGNASDLAVLADHVVGRLKTPTTAMVSGHRPDVFDAAWHAQGKSPLPETLPAGRKVAVAEEAWARKVSEMLTLTPYAGTGLTYFASFSDDGVFLADALDGGNPSAPKVYGLVHACQHLAAFGVSSRGRQAHRFGTFPKLSGLKGRRLANAGSGCSDTVTKMGGTWVIGGSPPAAIVPKQLNSGGVDPKSLVCDASLKKSEKLFTIKDFNGCDFAPGALFVYANRAPRDDANIQGNGSFISGGYEYELKNFRQIAKWKIGKSGLLGDNTSGAHVGFVLRTDPTGPLGEDKPEDGRFQLLDTGGFDVKGRGDGVTVLAVGQGFHTGNFDGPDTDRIGAGVPYRGVGVWTRMKPADGEALDQHVRTVLDVLRPMGLARLVLVDRGKKIGLADLMKIGTPSAPWMLYASPVVPMYEADDRANYAISRYVWSLRGMPASDKVAAMWWIYAPQRALARAMLEAGRGASIQTIAQAAFDRIKNPLTKRNLSIDKKSVDVHVAKLLAKYTMPLIDMRVTSTGTVHVFYKYPKLAKMTKLHYAERVSWDGKIRLPMDRAYLSPGQSDGPFPGYLKP